MKQKSPERLKLEKYFKKHKKKVTLDEISKKVKIPSKKIRNYIYIMGVRDRVIMGGKKGKQISKKSLQQQDKVKKFVSKNKNKYSVNEISKKLNMNYTSTYLALKRLDYHKYVLPGKKGSKKQIQPHTIKKHKKIETFLKKKSNQKKFTAGQIADKLKLQYYDVSLFLGRNENYREHIVRGKKGKGKVISPKAQKRIDKIKKLVDDNPNKYSMTDIAKETGYKYHQVMSAINKLEYKKYLIKGKKGKEKAGYRIDGEIYKGSKPIQYIEGIPYVMGVKRFNEDTVNNYADYWKDRGYDTKVIKDEMLRTTRKEGKRVTKLVPIYIAWISVKKVK